MPLVQPHEIDVEEIRRPLHVLLQCGARLYMHFARETLAGLGEAGGMTVREHLRRYGHWRGSEMRQAHHALGREINMETLNRCWDSASVFVVKDSLESTGRYTPSDVIYDVRYCPAAEAWQAEGFHQWGHAYCDEFHQACASTYHPDGTVVIPINMMKGDDHCHFRWVMPATARQLELGPPTALGRRLARYYRADTPQRGAYDALVRTSRLIGGRYWTMTRALLARHHAEAAEAVIRRFLRRWGAQRGGLLRAEHEARRLAPSPENLIREIDLAAKYVWEMTEECRSRDRYVVTVAWTPMDEAWADLDAGCAARLFWEESLPPLAEHYDPALSLEIAALRWRGDDRTRLVVTRRS
jgi:hypothetical protein